VPGTRSLGGPRSMSWRARGSTRESLIWPGAANDPGLSPGERPRRRADRFSPGNAARLGVPLPTSLQNRRFGRRPPGTKVPRSGAWVRQVVHRRHRRDPMLGTAPAGSRRVPEVTIRRLAFTRPSLYATRTCDPYAESDGPRNMGTGRTPAPGRRSLALGDGPTRSDLPTIRDAERGSSGRRPRQPRSRCQKPRSSMNAPRGDSPTG
jgi:hypothetical protein